MHGQFLTIIRVLFIYLLATPCGMWDLSPVTRDELEPPALGVWSPDHWTGRWTGCRMLQLRAFLPQSRRGAPERRSKACQ